MRQPLPSSSWPTLSLLLLLSPPAAPTCYHGPTPDPSPNYLPCGPLSPSAPHHCCSLNLTGPPGAQPADNPDTCLDNGLCAYTPHDSGRTEYWVNGCDNPDGVGCLDLRCEEALDVPRYNRMTPCGGGGWEAATRWCCGGDDACCGEEAWAGLVREIGTRFGEAGTMTTTSMTSMTTEGLVVASTEVVLATTTVRVEGPSETGAAEVAKGLAMGEKVGIGVAGGMSVLVALAVAVLVARRRRKRREKDLGRSTYELNAADTVEVVYELENTAGKVEMPGPLPLHRVLRQELG